MSPSRRQFLRVALTGAAVLPLAGKTLASDLLPTSPEPALSDLALLDELERAAFEFFWNEANPETGLVLDRSNANGSGARGMASIAATGFGLTALFATLPVLLSLFHRKATWIERLILLAATAISALLLVLPEHYLAKSDSMATSFLPETLFYVHANLIADQMDEDIACGDCGQRGCEWLDRIKSELREEVRRSWKLNQNYRSLGFDPDYLMYTSEKIRQWREKFFQGEDAKRFRFYWYYAERALMKHPARALAKVWRQMRHRARQD